MDVEGKFKYTFEIRVSVADDATDEEIRTALEEEMEDVVFDLDELREEIASDAILISYKKCK